MNVLKRNYMVSIVLITIINSVSLAAQDETYYFYDKSTDDRIVKTLEKSQEFLADGEIDKAIELLVDEQARLDRQRKVINLEGTFVKTSDGQIRRLSDGQLNNLPSVSEENVLRPPSPLMMALMSILSNHKYKSSEISTEYQNFMAKYKGNVNSIIATAEAIEFLGSNDENTWTFVDNTFNQKEKDFLAEYLLKEYLEGYLKQLTINISCNQLPIGEADSVMLNADIYNQIIAAVTQNGGKYDYIPFKNHAFTSISLREIKIRIQQNDSINDREAEIVQAITDTLIASGQGITNSNLNQLTRFKITLETYTNLVNALNAIEVSSEILTFQPLGIKLAVNDIKKMMSSNQEYPNLNDIKMALNILIHDGAPENIKNYRLKLPRQQSDILDDVFWDYCPQWTDYNLQNRLKRAAQLTRERRYEDAYELYYSIKDRYNNQTDIAKRVLSQIVETRLEQAVWYRDNHLYSQALEIYNNIIAEYAEQKDLLDQARYLSLENCVEDVLLVSHDYTLLAGIVNAYEELFKSETQYTQKANTIKAICQIISGNEGNTRDHIQANNISIGIFENNRIVERLPYEQRMIFDEYVWKYFPEWQDYNITKQYEYASRCVIDAQYTQSLRHFARLYERYLKDISPEMINSYLKAAVRAEETNLTTTILSESSDLGETELLAFSDVIWLIQRGKVNSAASVINDFQSAFISQGSALNENMKFYLIYTQMLMGKYEDAKASLNEMKVTFPQSLNTIKISYLIEQKERIKSAFELTKNDSVTMLLSKAGKCFDDGDLEMAMAIYLRIFAEYPDRQEDASRACYLLGYYYLLSGDFEAANEILNFLKKEYSTTPYAQEADVLIQRIKSFIEL